MYSLFLDAKSCFGRVLVQNVINNALCAGITGNTLNVINNRLSYRSSYVKFKDAVIGPINDSQGVKQGGLLSDG